MKNILKPFLVMALILMAVETCICQTKVTLTDVSSIYTFLSGKTFFNSNNYLIFDLGGRTGIYKGIYNNNYETKVNVDVRLGGISYATITFTDPTGRQQRLPICNLGKNGDLTDETAAMTENVALRKIDPNAGKSGSATTIALKVDTLVLSSGGGSPSQGIFLYFIDKNKKQLVADGKIDSAIAGNTKVPIIVGDQPPLKVNSAYVNKKFAVYYQTDSITTPDDNVIVGLKVSQLVLIKSSENRLKGLLKKLNQ